MRNLKKSLSIVLTLALLVSSVFVGGITATAATNLYTTVNTYDDESDIVLESYYDETLQAPIINANDSWVYETFGAYGTHVVQNPLSEETDNVIFFDRVKSKTNSWPASVRIYKQGTETAKTTYSLFVPKAGTTYEYEFKYYVKQTAVGVDIQIRDTLKRMHGAQDEYKYNPDRIHTTAVTVEAGTSTDGWVTAKGYFNTGSWSNGLGLFLASTTSGEDYNAEIYIDDIRISECVPLTVFDYDGSHKQVVYTSEYTTLADLSIPERDGYILSGVYGDEALNNKLNAASKAINYVNTGVYYGWTKLNPGEYYAGFENYKPEVNHKSYDSTTTAIVSGNTYAGGFNLRIDAPANSLNSFELRDKTAFETKAETKYVITFQYRATAPVVLYAGTAQASNVTGTATAIKRGDLAVAGEWTSASIEVTLDKGYKEGYVPVLMVQSVDAAIVEFDHIYLTYPVEETQNITNGFVTSTDWYPSIDTSVEEEPDEPEPIKIWDGSRVAPTADENGIYIIDTPEKLAYIVYNSGKMIIGETVTQQQVVDADGNPVLDDDGNPTYEDVTVYQYDTDCTFKLTKDIYLNDITKYDWLSGVAAGSGIRSWYEDKSFNGTIDGNFHTIYGLYSRYKWSLYHSNNGGAGFISELKNGDKATIKNLTIDYAMVRGGTNAGAFVGGANASTVVLDSCIAGANVYVEAYRSGAFLGGAKQPTATLTNCASFATTVYAEGSSNASTGLVSEYYLTRINVHNCFNANGPIATGSAGGLVVTNSFETVAGGETEGVTVLNKEQMQGKNVLKEGGAMAALNLSANYWTATDSYPILTASTGAEVIVKEIWDKTTQAPVDSDGDGVYEINSPKELAYVIYNGGTMIVGEESVEGCSFILTRDIYLNDLSKYDWTSFTRLPWGQTTLNEWYDTSTDGAAFSGTIDGNNHSVYGLYSHYQWTDTYAGWDKGRGLIPSIANGKTATVKNLNIDCVFVHNEVCGAGVMVGVNYGTAIFENCSVGAKVYVNGSYAGAFVGANNTAEGVSLNNCYSLATLHGENDAGTTASLSGLITNNWMSTGGKIIINNCYNANGAVSAESATITNSYATEVAASGVTILTADQMQGEKALENMPNLNSAGAYTLTTELKYPALISFVSEDDIYVPEVEEEEEEVVEDFDGIPDNYPIWDGTSVAPTEGEGTEANPWKIYTGAELYYVIANNGGAGVYYQLQNDIYLNDLSKINWQTGSISYGYKVNAWKYGGSTAFKGNIDGNGFVVRGIYAHDGTIGPATAPTYSMGLISTIQGNTTIKNLGVDYSFFHHEATAGGFIGCVYGTDVTATITNCYVGENVNAEANLAGGFIGAVAGGGSVNISNCYSLATSKAFIGSLYYNSKPANITIKNCYYLGKFFANMNYTGAYSVSNCYEGDKGTTATGVTTVSAADMKGEAAATAMSGLSLIAKEANFAQANYNTYVYLPAGTTFDADFAPLFFDNRMAPLDKEDVMFTNRMVRGAYVKFQREVDVTKINVPVSTAHRVAFGTAQDLLAAGYYDLETQVISDNLADQPDTAVNYIFITDPHFDTQGTNGRPITKNNSVKQFALAIKMANEMDEIDFICLGGDLANGSYGSSDSWSADIDTYLAVINECTKPVFVLVGNHDDNCYGEVKDTVTLEQLNARIMTNDKWQAAIIDKYVNRTLADGTVIKVTQDEDPYKDVVNSKYYYYDLEGKNTRVICLNASDYEYAYDENGEFTLIHNTSTSVNVRSNTYNGYTFWGYSKYQMEWLAEEALGTLPDGYNVVVLSHMAITKSSSGKETYHNGTVLSDIMAAYQNKTAYNHDEYGISADFGADTGRIMAYQHGHEHIVYEKYNADPQVWQFSSSTTNPHSGGLTDRILNENGATIDVMSATVGYVYKQALGQGDSGMFINPYVAPEGDVNLDTQVDICDLVALKNMNADGLVTAVMPTADFAKMRDIILGK